MKHRGLLGAAAAVCLALLALAGCGSDANLDVSNGSAQCGGGGGVVVRGAVAMPHGRVAAAPSAWERVAALALATAEALSGDARRVGGNVPVELVQLRPEDLEHGAEPGRLESSRTNSKGEYCMALRRDTDETACRYVVQVGSLEDSTRTRAFVFSTDRVIDIDYRSEAAVQVVLAKIPPAGLCDFSPEELESIYQAVLDMPGEVNANSAAEANAIAATMAAADPGVQAAIVDAVGALPTPQPSNTFGPSPTRTVGPPPTATSTRSSATRTSRPTRTPFGGVPTATHRLTNTPSAPTRTATATGIGATVTATRPANTPTATSAAATPTRTVGVGPSNTPTATKVPSTPGGALGERIFTIREDSMFPGTNPRSAMFSTGLAGNSLTDRLSAGPLTLVAGAPDANGIAPLSVKSDAYFWVRIPAGNSQLCFRVRAAGSSGSIDCDGGTATGVRIEQAAGTDPPPATWVLNIGDDAGPGAAILKAHVAIAQQTPGATCDATATFPEGGDVYFSSSTAAGLKGARTLSKPAENFDCANWKTTDGPGMLALGIVGYDSRAGGDVVNILRIADM